MIKDEPLIKNSQWYNYPKIYHIFSFAEDKDMICIDIIKKYIQRNKVKIVNPVDLGSGTGKIFEQLIKKINYDGNAYFVESNSSMIKFLESKYLNEVVIVKSKISNFNLEPVKSNFIISSFGFPSKLMNSINNIKELKNIYKNLSEDGIFITIGWNEKWNDELSVLWKKYIDKNIRKNIKGARNCNLTWYKNDIKTKLEFDNKEDRDYALLNLFGSKVKKELYNPNKLQWSMKMGITLNTKKELENIIKSLEKKNERN